MQMDMDHEALRSRDIMCLSVRWSICTLMAEPFDLRDKGRLRLPFPSGR